MSNLRVSMLGRIQWNAQCLFSRLIGLLCDCEWRWVKNPLIWGFMHTYRIELSDYLKTRIRDYKSLNDFFMRSLKPGARAWQTESGLLLSPVDGCISQMGAIQGETLVQAKGKTYTLQDLFAGNQDSVHLFKNGYFFTLYLAPSDYHRVHMPIGGTVLHKTYVPGFLFSVGARNTKRVSQLFTRNERIISLFETDVGPLAIVQVGSCLVGHMGTVWEDTGSAQRRSSMVQTTYPDKGYHLAQADTMGYFKLGSTVILLLGSGAIQPEENLYVGKRLYCGESLGKMLPRGIEPLFTP